MATRLAGANSTGPAPYRRASPTAACIWVTPFTETWTTAPAYEGCFGFSGLGCRKRLSALMSFGPYGGNAVPAVDGDAVSDGTAPLADGAPGLVQTAVFGSGEEQAVSPPATAARPSPSTPRRRTIYSAIPRTAWARAVRAMEPSSVYGSRARRFSRSAARSSSVNDIV